ncbi:MAG TPA: TetR/AcrR family transcriptional regulator [Baekduia sp.]|nr:TetR/AcrR family transcriptional regulator [Baekduia sp.]
MMNGRSPHARAAHQLPSGRHGLPRDFVISNQRERILGGVMIAVSRNGYGRTRVEDVIALAGVSRRTFYDHFANKHEAFMAAYDFVVEQLRVGVAGAYATGGTWASKVRRGLAAFLNLLAGEPELAHVCIVEVVAAGPDALERRMAAMADFRQFLTPPTPEHPPVIVSAVTAETVVGGVYEVIYSRVVTHRTEELPGLLPALLYSVLLPFAGPEIAGAEYRHAAAAAAARTAQPAPTPF